jgi:DNA-binding response OmpR family regulator
MARILIVDDESRIGSFVTRALTAAGYGADVAHDGEQGLRQALTGVYQLVMLDLRLPRMDGNTVLERLIAERPSQAILVLSAVADVEQKVRCLSAGAQDYLTKPFALTELLARVEARLRVHSNDAVPRQRVVGQVVLESRRRLVDAGNGPVHLSNREFAVLDHLMSRADDVCSREELLADVWGYWFDPGSNVVDVMVKRLRTKIGSEVIETVRNVGYRFCAV